MDREYFNILIFGHKTSKTKQLWIHEKTFKIGIYLLAFALLSITFFLCDYIQVKKRVYHLNRHRQETQTQRSRIQFFSARIEDLEKRISKLKDFDRKIRIIANLERGQEMAQFMGMDGPLSSPSNVQEKLKKENW